MHLPALVDSIFFKFLGGFPPPVLPQCRSRLSVWCSATGKSLIDSETSCHATACESERSETWQAPNRKKREAATEKTSESVNYTRR